MKMFQFLFGETRDSFQPYDAMHDFWYQPLGTEGYGNYISAETAMSITAVYTCVRILAESLGSLPLHLYRRIGEGAKERETKHPLTTLIKRPNVWMTKIEFWEYMISWVAMRGNSFARKIYSKGGDILQLIPLDPRRMEIEQQGSGLLLYHFQLKSGMREVYKQEDIFHLRGLPFDGILGISPLQSLQRVLGYQMELLRYGAAFFRNNAQPGGKVMHPAKMSAEAQKNLKDSIQKSYTGENVGKVMVLEEGVKFEAAEISHSDLQFIEIQKVNKGDIYSAFRISPHLAGDLDRATFSNIEQLSQEFVQFTLQPWLVRCEEAIWRDLIHEKDKKDLFAEFLTAGLLRGIIDQRYNAYVKGLTNGFLNADEVRSYENLNPIPDGSGQIFRVPLNLTSSDQVGEPASSEPSGTPSTPGAAEPTEGRSKLNELFLTMFTEQYGRLIKREEKTTKKTDEWRAEHREFVAKSLEALLTTYVELSCYTERQRLASADLKQKIASFAADKDSELSGDAASKINMLWGMIKKELNAVIGDS